MLQPADYLIVFYIKSDCGLKNDWRCVNGSFKFAKERAIKRLSSYPEGSTYAIYELKSYSF